MYINHIKAFNNFKEPDGSKNNKNDFIKSCNNFINNNNCPDTIIPISKQKIIIDGSHRVANSIIKKHKTLCCEFDIEDLFFDFNFFLKRGFKRKYCDYIGFTIIDLVKNITFLKIHFTNKKQYHEKLEKLNNEYEVYYYIKKKRSINLINNGNGQWLILPGKYEYETVSPVFVPLSLYSYEHALVLHTTFSSSSTPNLTNSNC